MKNIARISALALSFAFVGSTAAPLLIAQPTSATQDRDHDRDDSAYRNNRYFKQGWKDGQKHKHKNKHWKNDADREAYEAGYNHGNNGEAWQNERHHDRDRH